MNKENCALKLVDEIILYTHMFAWEADLCKGQKITGNELINIAC